MPFAIEEVNKAAANWCSHCTVGKGCNIYPERPHECRVFTCLWLNGKGEECDRPDRLNVVMDISDGVLEVGIFHLWEIEEGALEQPRVRQIAESVKDQGFVVAYHRLLPTAAYKSTLTIPQGLLTDGEIELLVETMT